MAEQAAFVAAVHIPAAIDPRKTNGFADCCWHSMQGNGLEPLRAKSTRIEANHGAEAAPLREMLTTIRLSSRTIGRFLVAAFFREIQTAHD